MRNNMIPKVNYSEIIQAISKQFLFKINLRKKGFLKEIFLKIYTRNERF